MRLGRREFLKLAGATTALGVPGVAGFRLYDAARGDDPPQWSPYASLEEYRWIRGSAEEGAPILLLLNEHSDNPFGAHLGEILLCEGLNVFRTAFVSQLTDLALERFDAVVLAEGPLEDEQVDRLGWYLLHGGGLVAMRPVSRLADTLGVAPTGASLADGYLQTVPGHSVGAGISGIPLQFHGEADLYDLSGAEAVAWLTTRTGEGQRHPAVTVNRYGEGLAAMWTFDLARSVAYMRQGNPALANRELDGVEVVRAGEMFTGWVDLDRLAVPQADEQQRLLANLLTHLGQARRPLPRIWYFPVTADAMLIATGDAHQNPASAVEEVLSCVEQRGGHMSIYYAPPGSGPLRRAMRKAKRDAEGTALLAGMLANPHQPPTPARIADWRARGHEFTLHPYVEEGLEEGWRRAWQEFTALDYGPVSETVRTHRILWTGWVETARVQAALGVRMNLDYYHWGPTFRDEGGNWAHGHLTGSGLPMRFIDEDGRVLDVLQQLTQLVDEHLLDAFGGPAELSVDGAAEVSRALLNQSLAGAYAAVVTQFHIDPFAAGDPLANRARAWMSATLDHAVEHGIPIWSAQQWTRFVQARQAATVDDVQWDLGTKRLSFLVSCPRTHEVALCLMVPVFYGGAALAEVAVEGVPLPAHERQVGASIYGCFSLPSQTEGTHRVMAVYQG